MVSIFAGLILLVIIAFVIAGLLECISALVGFLILGCVVVFLGCSAYFYLHEFSGAPWLLLMFPVAAIIKGWNPEKKAKLLESRLQKVREADLAIAHEKLRNQNLQ